MAKFRKHEGEWDPDFQPDGLKKITITEVTPYYHGADEEDYKGIMTPFCWLTAKVDYGGTNIATHFWKSEIPGLPLRPGEGIK